VFSLLGGSAFLVIIISIIIKYSSDAEKYESCVRS